jgi:hypothetical protein
MLSPLYGQLSPLRIPTKVRQVSSDADANSYLLAVESADGQQLEDGVIAAVESFVLGCKSDGIWSALKASCILAGARTLSGALVPLAGTAPTNSNFVTADYNRETGLLGNGTTKYLNSNRAGNADPQDNIHQSVFLNALSATQFQAFIGIGASVTGATQIVKNVNHVARNRSNSAISSNSLVSGFLGCRRSSSTSVSIRHNSSTSNASITSQTFSDPSAKHYIYARNQLPAAGLLSAARISFYSIGESIDLALLDTRVSNLMTALAAAIP